MKRTLKLLVALVLAMTFVLAVSAYASEYMKYVNVKSA